MDEKLAAEFNTEEPTEFHKKLLEHCKKLVDMSRRHMQGYYDRWDRNNDVFQGVRTPDKDDADAKSRKEPEKMVVPLSYAQVDTLVSFCISLFTQRERVFELVGVSEEDHKAAKFAEAIVDRDLSANCFVAKLDQFLMDISRFSLGVLKVSWEETKDLVPTTIEIPSPVLNDQPMFAQPQQATVMQEQITFQGNRITNVSPYSFFPDVRLPLSRFQEGEFVASEDLYSLSQLYQWQFEQKVVGVEWVKPFKNDSMDERVRRNHLSRALERTTGTAETVSGEQKTLGTFILTEVQIVIIPKLFTIESEGETIYPFGESQVPEKWLVWYVNDHRIINVERLSFDHNMFTYDIAEFRPDIHGLVGICLCDVIDKLQDVTSWLVNTHITNVRKVIGDKLIVDPSLVVMEDLKERRPVIRLSKDAARIGVDKAIKQLDVTDVTSKHMGDATELHGLVQIATGINDNAMGQYFTGRRTATESRNANSGAAARLKKLALLIFKMALEPLARKMIKNHQQGLTVETFVKVAGPFADMQVFEQFVKVDRTKLVGSWDFEIFDGTLPSERGIQAQALEEFLLTLMGNPQTVMLMGYDPQKLVEEWLELRGIRNPKRFLLTQVRMALLQQQMQQNGLISGPKPTGQPGLPQEQGGVSSGGVAPNAGSVSSAPE